VTARLDGAGRATELNDLEAVAISPVVVGGVVGSRHSDDTTLEASSGIGR